MNKYDCMSMPIGMDIVNAGYDFLIISIPAWNEHGIYNIKKTMKYMGMTVEKISMKNGKVFLKFRRSYQ